MCFWPQYPLACPRTLRRFLRACTDRLTRGISVALLALSRLRQPEQLAHLADVRAVDRVILSEAPLALRALLLEVVALHRVPAHQATRSGHLEPLLRSRARLLLRHSLLPPSPRRRP